ncbi:hypothetical protein Tco_0670445, partial [Tanacetum coccineum]
DSWKFIAVSCSWMMEWVALLTTEDCSLLLHRHSQSQLDAPVSICRNSAASAYDNSSKTNGSKKKANTDTITKQKPPTAPTEKKSGKGKLKTTELETISEADLTEAEQLKIITKRSRQETHSSHASGSGADEGTGVTPGVPDAPDYDSEDDISWKSSDDDQDDEQAQDDEDAGKNDVNETKQDDEDDDEHDDNETDQNDDDEEQTESDDDGDDFVHPKLTTHDDDIIHEEDTDEDDSRISSSDDEDSDNEVEGANVEGAKTDEEATYEEDQGNEAVDDTNTDLDRRDDVMTDVILPQSSLYHLGFVSQHAVLQTKILVLMNFFGNLLKPTSLIDTSCNSHHGAILHCTNSIAIQHLLESVEVNFSGNSDKPNQYVKRSPPSWHCDQYLANKLPENRGRCSPIEVRYSEAALQGITIRGMVADDGSRTLRLEHTGVPKEEGQEKNLLLPVLQVKRQPRQQERLPVQDLRLTENLLANLLRSSKQVVHDDQQRRVQHLPDWFQQPTRLPSPDHAWNKSVLVVHESVQPWLSNLAQQDPRESFDELHPTTKKLDWINPEGRQYPHDLRHPLPLVPNTQGRHVIPFHHFINNDLEYLRGGVSSRKLQRSIQIKEPQLVSELCEKL